jgi:ubiquitin-protein ligase
MFRNQFMIIDVDKGGSVDAEELQELTESLGNRLSYEEAEELIAEFDLDRSGTIDFGEFLTLMFKIKSGTIDAANNKLVTAILESKNQIKIFHEIEQIKNDPPQFIGVVGYGGVPVVCDFVIQGPKNTSYQDGYFGVRVVFNHGYPYKAPTVVFTSRIIAVNVLQMVDGTGTLMHFEKMWDSKWNMRRLLTHIVEVFISPDNPKPKR